MATISYYNNVLPIGGRSFNPGFEEVLDPTFTLGTTGTGVYEIVNNDGGPFQGFKVQFISNVNGSGNFSYVLTDTDELKPSGTIAVINLLAPNGTNIAQVMPGAAGFGDAKLEDFYARLTNPNAETPKDAIFSALDNLFGKADVIYGTAVADHLTNFGYGVGQMNAGAGNDILTSKGSATMAGEAGSDLLRVSYGTYSIHGANADGSGGAGETNTLEIRGSADSSTSADITKVTDIDVLRFVDTNPSGSTIDDSPSLRVHFNVDDIKAGGLSPTLKVFGSEAASPFSENGIDLRVDYTATKGASIDLSRWTFSNWDADDSYINISTSAKLALADVIVGSKVGDSIYAGAGNDVIRGGGGADYMSGDRGSDTFVFGSHEAAPGEYISEYDDDSGVDRMLVLGDNDFSEAGFYGIEVLAFGGKATAAFNQYIVGSESPIQTVQGDGNANTLAIKVINFGDGQPAVDLSELAFKSWSTADKVTIDGSNAADAIAGSVMGDVIDGGLGSDDLQGNAGADTFLFSLNTRGVDHVADFLRKEGDKIGLVGVSFPTLKAGVLKKKAFEIGEEADSRKDRVIYDKQDGIVRYDDDGTGKHKAVIVAVLDDAAVLKAGDILVI
jgi:Ca2+-binding RTX toxin-like protein